MTAPNWRKSKDYPDPAHTGLERWAWEFLRRNPAFEAEATPAAVEHRAMQEAGQLPAAWNQRPLGKVLRKWGVLFPIPADWKGHGLPVRFELAPRAISHATINGKTVLVAPIRDDRLVLQFDLDCPLEPQLERAGKLLAANQRTKFPSFKRKRNQIEKFPGYLRVLDALAAGAKARQIVDCLSVDYPEIDERTLGYWNRKATELRDGGYRELLTQ